eukprot:scaffold174109_cov30-Tisochrysis_lutea.AAC.7
MVLHTSGSTGNKKVVPHTLGDLLAGAICIAAACELKPTDICCNQMPLFHIVSRLASSSHASSYQEPA